MLYFRNDYGNGAHPAVWEALRKTNEVLTPGYGTDRYCRQAEETIRTLCQSPQAAVHFLTGGTQVNKAAICAFLRPYEAVVSHPAVRRRKAHAGHAPGRYGRAVLRV